MCPRVLWSPSGRRPPGVGLALGKPRLSSLASSQAIATVEEQTGPLNQTKTVEADHRSELSTHGYTVSADTCKGSVSHRVPTGFRPKSPRSRQKTLCFQCCSRQDQAQICPLTANSGQPATFKVCNGASHVKYQLAGGRLGLAVQPQVAQVNSLITFEWYI